MQLRGEFHDVSAGTAFDTLLDGEYRRMWDENVIEDYELCALDGTNDIGYYSCKHSFTRGWWIIIMYCV